HGVLDYRKERIGQRLIASPPKVQAVIGNVLGLVADEDGVWIDEYRAFRAHHRRELRVRLDDCRSGNSSIGTGDVWPRRCQSTHEDVRNAVAWRLGRLNHFAH